jgi:hypothetical protein
MIIEKAWDLTTQMYCDVCKNTYFYRSRWTVEDGEKKLHGDEITAELVHMTADPCTDCNARFGKYEPLPTLAYARQTIWGLRHTPAVKK